MHRRRFPAAGRWPHAARATLTLSLAAALTGGLIQAHAQTAVPPAAQDPLTLRAAFEAAWARQPEALALATRRDAARAQAQAAQSWTPEPVAVGLSTKTDRLNRNLGTREYEVGVAIPLWLPGERGRSQALADAEGRAVESRTTAAQLRIAAAVREAWWSWQRAHAELEAARGQLENVRRIAADVGKRLKAGDLARADQHQADAAVAVAEGAVAQADGALTVAQQHLRSLTAMPAVGLASAKPSQAEPEPPTPATATAEMDDHAELLALKDRAAVAEGAIALAATQSRASPELTIDALPPKIRDQAPSAPAETPDTLPHPPPLIDSSLPPDLSFESALSNFKRELVRRALRECHNSRSEAAQRLKISRQYLHKMILELGIEE